ncbi:DUF5937 family protein [Amycolatopsis sp. PS_44_ISF1]|uniref:DUF5937 family protein n=1 Tax=Amycolatopsis sp. PS_44_ISF1 TaxID=2974917 RepID=UPI0028DE6162|nr:DUF5937 family protein [Amycolatopsis sp. PS_44_ISF1]MDT8912437.1 DUF5937 family protein [Amycolatopsis sp. PS_44_ISF1]
MQDVAWTVDELARTRLAFSPLWEIVASAGVLRHPGEHALHLPWVKRASVALDQAGIDLTPLAGLVAGRPVPRFLAPVPASPVPELADELADLRDVPARAVRRELERTDPPWPPALTRLHRDPEAGLERLANLMERYWAVALAPAWPRMRALLEGDVLHRSRLLADGAAQDVFADLAPAVRWADGGVAVAGQRVPAPGASHGRGLVLAPSVFVWPRVVSRTHAGSQPVLRYPARGLAGLWEAGGTQSPAALRGVLGRSRSILLAALATPADSAGLARRTGLKAAVVAKHLELLSAAGLLTTTPDGVHVRTSAADDLVAAGE